MTQLTSLKNIGKELERKLRAVGIETAEELKEVGSKIAFARLKMHFPRVCLVHLYSLQGAISSIDFNRLPDTVKSDLKAFSNGLKCSCAAVRRSDDKIK